jgi:membrane associated rhomboid family serine protease
MKKNYALSLFIMMMIVAFSLLPFKINGFTNEDKMLHFAFYFIFGFSLTFSFKKFTLFFIPLPAVIELIQPYFNRVKDVRDALASLAGMGGGVLLALILKKLTDKKPE